MLKYYLDRDGDIWASDGDRAVCVLVNPEAEFAVRSSIPVATAAMNFGPLSELKPGDPVRVDHSEMTA